MVKGALVGVSVGLILSGCTTVHDLGGGRYIVPRMAETRSPFGTNTTWTKLEACDGVQADEPGLQPLYPTMTYRNCQSVTEWVPMSSQGQGGQIVQGVLNAAGLVGLGAVMGNSNTTVNSSANSSASATGGSVVNGAGRGHGH